MAQAELEGQIVSKSISSWEVGNVLGNMLPSLAGLQHCGCPRRVRSWNNLRHNGVEWQTQLLCPRTNPILKYS